MQGMIPSFLYVATVILKNQADFLKNRNISAECVFLFVFLTRTTLNFAKQCEKTNFSVVSRRFVWFASKIDGYIRLKYYEFFLRSEN